MRGNALKGATEATQHNSALHVPLRQPIMVLGRVWWLCMRNFSWSRFSGTRLTQKLLHPCIPSHLDPGAVVSSI